MQPKIHLAFFLLTISFSVGAQTIIDTLSFPFDNGTDGWQIFTGQGEGEWTWEVDGKAEDGLYWGEREAIQSNSGGGAMVFNAAALNGAGNGGQIVSGFLVSPIMNFTNEATVYLRFHQYFRNYSALTQIEYAQEGSDWQAINLAINQNVGLNIETGAADYQVIDISDEVGGQPDIQIRFVFEGDYYFWIVDDIEFYDGPPILNTLPEYVGDSLRQFGYPYATDDSDWPYVPYEIVVQFKQNTPPATRQMIRQEFAAELIDSCACDRLELWRLGDQLIAGGDTLSSDGGSIGVQERVKGAGTKTSIDGVDFNRYNYHQMQDIPFLENIPFTFDSVVGNPTTDDMIRIAILDTGIDLAHDSLLSVLYHNTQEPPEANGVDEDNNCLVDDWYGWNFVDNNNNPNDDHSHGTHVAGIIRQSFLDFSPDCTDYRLIPYKTHDYHGLATLFDVACATYQAVEDKASVINDSWGFYGNESTILKNAIDTIKQENILVITAAGNDSTNLASMAQYPACYPNSNIITVGAYGLDAVGSIFTPGFSNYDSTCVDILAPGVSISSTVLDDAVGEKSGTSMAAPAVAAAAAMIYCVDGDKHYLEVKDNILDCATVYPAFTWRAHNGRVLDFNFSCLTPVEELLPADDPPFVSYPNPVWEQLCLEARASLGDGVIRLYNVNGQLLSEQTFTDWTASDIYTIEVGDYMPGIYFLVLQSDAQTWAHKWIKGD
jgi:hypothetical protein